MNEPELFDAAIVGGGPAGLSAAIWLARHMRSVVLVDSGDPRNWETRGIHGYLGRPDVTPAELRGLGRDEARRYGVLLIDGCVEHVERAAEESFRLTTVEIGNSERPGEIPPWLRGRPSVILGARRLLLAIGIKDVWPDVPGLERCYGETAHHCPDCDGYEALGCRTVVISSGRSAVGLALDLATWTRDIVICTNGQPAELDDALRSKLEALAIPVVPDRIVRVDSRAGRVEGLELESGRLLPCERIFFALGHYPADDLASQLGCARDEQGFVTIDRHYHTSVPNVFAAGDIVAGPYLALRAAADGAIAGLAMHRSLLEPALRLD